MNGMEIQLTDFQDGKPIVFRGENQTVDQVNKLKTSGRYKELLQLTYSLPNTINTYLLRANALLHLKQWNKLIDCCNNGLLMDESQSELYNLKGKAYGKLGNQVEKVSLLKIAIELNEKVPAYHRNLGAALYNLKNYPNAVEEHSIAIQLEPNNPINYHNKGAALFRSHHFQQAKVFFRLAFEKDPKLALSYSWLGDCERELGNPEESVRLYSKAYEISGNKLYLREKQKVEKHLNPPKEQKKRFFGLF